ncbi:MAG: hypothetical protein AABZ30_04800, partial [Myxococcota bacterium]
MMLRSDGDRARLVFDASTAGPLRVDLEISVSGVVGDASPRRLRHRRLPLATADLSLTEESLRAFLAGAAASGSAQRDDVLPPISLDARMRPGWVLLLGRVRGARGEADFSARALLDVDGEGDLRVLVPEVLLYGWIGAPGAIVPPAIFASIVTALRDASAPAENAAAPLQALGAAQLRLRPLDALLGVLPAQGFRLPDCRGVALLEAAFEGGVARVRYGAPAGGKALAAHPELRRALDAARESDAAITAGSWDDAARALREHADSPSSHPALVARLFDLLAAMPESFDEAEACARRAVDRRETRIAALLCLGRVAEGRAQLASASLDEASERYRAAAEAAAQGGDPEEEARARLACGKALAAQDPEAAAAVYESALARTDAPGPLLDALADLYDRAGRGADLVQALCARIALGLGADEESRMRLRLARVHTRLGDVPAALREVERALDVGSLTGDALAAVADAAQRSGDAAWATGVLEAQAREAADAGDHALEAQAEATLADVLARADRPDEARAHLGRARALRPQDAALALRAAALDVACGRFGPALACYQAALPLLGESERRGALGAMA